MKGNTGWHARSEGISARRCTLNLYDSRSVDWSIICNSTSNNLQKTVFQIVLYVMTSPPLSKYTNNQQNTLQYLWCVLVTFLSATCFGHYCGHLQGDIIAMTTIQTYKCGQLCRHFITKQYTECFTTCGRYWKRWFPRSLWSKKFI